MAWASSNTQTVRPHWYPCISYGLGTWCTSMLENTPLESNFILFKNHYSLITSFGSNNQHSLG